MALEAITARFRSRFDQERFRALGAEPASGGSVEVQSLCWRFAVTPEPFSLVLLPGRDKVSAVWQILLLEYLSADAPQSPTRFLAFADFVEARGYMRAFEARVTRRLSGTAGRELAAFAGSAERCRGVRGASDPLTFLFRFFPRLELQVVRYEGDDEFPPSCNVLFPDNAPRLLSAESMAVAAERLVSSLEGKTPAG
jgi:hypothetical protein